jgi:uncharacterized membrane protein
MEAETRFYQRPWARVWMQLGFFLIVYLILSYLEQDWTLLVDGVIFGLLLLFWLFFFSQFILPVSKFADRLNIFTRLLAYLFGQHGAAVFVENGRVSDPERQSDAGWAFCGSIPPALPSSARRPPSRGR